ncbi:hypothetical protein [Nocardia sp. MW-W600-9]
MYEAHATVIGTVVTHPVRRDLTNGEQVVTFRMASNSRRFDAARSAPHAVRNISDRPRAIPPVPAEDAAEYAPTVPTAVASTTAADSLPARSPVAVPISGTPERVDA